MNNPYSPFTSVGAERAILVMDAAPETTESGIYLPPSERERNPRTLVGTVHAVGRPRMLDSGETTPAEVKAGDRVVVARHAGSRIEVDGQEYCVVRLDDILAVLE